MGKKWFKVLLVSAIITISYFGCSTNDSNTVYLGNIKGRVIDSTTHNGLDSAILYTVPPTYIDTSDVNGYYGFVNFGMGSSPSTYKVFATRRGYIPDSAVVAAVVIDTIRLNFTLHH